VTPGDAQIAFNFYLNCVNVNPTLEQYCAADFCGSGLLAPCDGSVTPADAQGIMREYLGYPVPCLKRSAAGNSARTLALSQRAGTAPGTIVVTVTLAGAGQPVSAFGIELTCGRAAAKLVSCAPGALNPGWTLFDCAAVDETTVRIGAVSIAGEIGAEQQGALAELTFALPQDGLTAQHLAVKVRSAVDDLAVMAVN